MGPLFLALADYRQHAAIIDVGWELLYCKMKVLGVK